MNQQTRNILFMVSSIAVIIGAAMPLFMPQNAVGFHTFMLSEPRYGRLQTHIRYKGKNFQD